MSGCFITVALGVWERHKNRSIVFRKYFWLMGFFIFMACFLAWRDEHIAVARLTSDLAEAKTNRFKPDLKFQVYNRGFGPFPERPNTSLLFLDMGVRNIGSPTSLRQWRVRVSPSGDKTYEGEVTLFDKPVYLQGRPDGPGRLVSPEDFLPERMLTPITTGGETTGTLFVLVNGLLFDSVKAKNVHVVINCADVNDKEYTTETDVETAGSFNPYLRLPGMKRPNP